MQLISKLSLSKLLIKIKISFNIIQFNNFKYNHKKKRRVKKKKKGSCDYKNRFGKIIRGKQNGG